MNIGLFGGTFDPIHRGHMALARTARERCKLSRILFVPAEIPPHKQSQPLSAFAHRYAMIALATAQERDFIPSLLEARELVHLNRSRKGKDDKYEINARQQKTGIDKTGVGKPNYTIDTIKRIKLTLKRPDRLFLVIGIDAFAEIAKWHQAEAIFRECEFVVASRPGFSLADVANALPATLRPRQKVTLPFHKQAATGDLVLSGVTIHLLDEVYQPISSTAIRNAATAGKSLTRFVDAPVADYIKKMGLYK